jgi:hypothetical protein
LKVMLTPAATHARSDWEAEWKKVPSPTFCTKWVASTKGAAPMKAEPSAPIGAALMVRRSCWVIIGAIPWQPIPPPTSSPSSETVERLWGQPGQ